MKTVTVDVPEKLYMQAVLLAKEGWFRDEKEIISEAIRRFIDTHKPEIIEKQIMEDVHWGLHGKD